MDVLDRFKGCLLGLAVGDALGMPVEGFTAEEIRSRFGKIREMMPAPVGHFHFGLQAGQYTDDTLETLLLAESILEAGGFSAERFADKLREWGCAWVLDESLNRGVGFATKSSIENMLAGASWKESGLPIPTCGSAMRVAPVGLFYNCDLSLVARYAELQSLPTHTSPAARAASIAVATGVALGLKEFPKEMVFQLAVSSSAHADPFFAERLRWAGSLLSLEPEMAAQAIGCSPEACETVPAAFYYYLKFEPEEGLIMAASSGGDSDSIASMAGALFGASCGMEWIPERWLACLEDRERIEGLAADLAELSFKFSPWARGEFISSHLSGGI